MMFKKTLIAAAMFTLGGFAATASAVTATGTFKVQMTILKSCAITTTAASTIQLGAVAGVASTATNTNSSGVISVNCSKTTPYSVGLLPTAANGGDANGNGNMISTTAPATNTDKVPYTLYQNAALSTVWGNTAGTNTLTAANGLVVGTGAATNYTVYAQAPSANFTPDSYADNVAVNVIY
ncbi:MAG: spore coat protein U domain-containing protein [Rhodanobacter sp.]